MGSPKIYDRFRDLLDVNFNSPAAGDIIYASSSSVLTNLAGNTTATNKVLRMISGTPGWVDFTSGNLNDGVNIALLSADNIFSASTITIDRSAIANSSEPYTRYKSKFGALTNASNVAINAGGEFYHDETQLVRFNSYDQLVNFHGYNAYGASSLTVRTGLQHETGYLTSPGGSEVNTEWYYLQQRAGLGPNNQCRHFFHGHNQETGENGAWTYCVDGLFSIVKFDNTQINSWGSTLVSIDAATDRLNVASSTSVRLGGGVSIGSTFYNTTPPTNGAIILGNVGIGLDAATPSQLLSVCLNSDGTIAGFGANGVQNLITLAYNSSSESVITGSSYGSTVLAAGSSRDLVLRTSGGQVTVSPATNTASSGTRKNLEITPTYNQTGTAGSTDLKIVRTETALGSGTHRFIDCYAGAAGTTNVAFLSNGTHIESSGTGTFCNLSPTFNQTSTAIGRVLTLTPSVTALGSGTSSAALYIAPTGTNAKNIAHIVLQAATAQSGYLITALSSTGVESFRVTTAGAYASSFNSLNDNWGLTTTGLQLKSDKVVSWGASTYYGTNDTGLARSAAGVVKVTDGSTGWGTIQAKTIYAFDETASTGVSKVISKAGAGQSTTELILGEKADGTDVFLVKAAGYGGGSAYPGMSLPVDGSYFVMCNTSIVDAGGGFTIVSDGNNSLNLQKTGNNGATAGIVIGTSSSRANTSGTVNTAKVNSVYNQASGTGCINTDLQITRTETSLGTSPGKQRFINCTQGSTDRFWIYNSGRMVASAPNSAIADADLDNSTFSFYLNEAGNTLTVKVKYAAGTVKTGTIAVV